MGWQDRHYNQNYGSNLGNPVLNFLFGSFSIGRWFNIDVRIHASLAIIIGLRLLFASSVGGVYMAVVSSVILFAIILLHEFGHCWGARQVGGSADQIILWPLGGLAFVDTPQRPWPSFVATACGPLVNLIICLVSGGFLYISSNFQYFPSLNPLLPFATFQEMSENRGFIHFINSSHINFYVIWIFSTSWMLLLFNLLPLMPMDGGRMLQEALWPITSYTKSMSIACTVGLIGSVLMAMFGVAMPNLFLILLAIGNLMYCYQMLMMLRAGAVEEPEGIDYAASIHGREPVRRRVKKRWFKSLRKKAMQEQAEQDRIDAILVKVKEKGLHSLTWWEKRTLKKATERQRQQDLAERL